MWTFFEKGDHDMKYYLPKDFMMGASAAAWQTEGWSGNCQDKIL